MLAAYSVKRKNEEGFTLIELLIVVIIIGILAAIALPIFIDQQKVAIDASVQSDLRNGVTNVTNAQAQGAGTEATLPQSRDNTKFFLNGTEVTDSNANKAGVQFAAPELGTPYVLAADNAGGKKFVTDAFTFTAITGKFTTEAAPSAGNGGSGSGGGNQATGETPTYESANYYGELSNFYLGRGEARTTQGGGNNGLILASGFGESRSFYTNSTPTSSSISVLDGLDYDADGTYLNSGDNSITDVQFLDGSGNSITALDAAFDGGTNNTYTVSMTDAASDTADHPKGSVHVSLDLGAGGYGGGAAPQYSASDLSALRSVTFRTADGTLNTMNVKVPTYDFRIDN